MELGTLLVKLSANTTGFSSQMSAGAKSLEDFAKGAKKISGDLGQVGLAVTAFGGAMTALAATIDGRAEKSLNNLKHASAVLGVQIFDVVAPAIKDMTEGLKRAADMIAALSPSVRASASHFAEWAVGIGAAGMALQKAFTLGEALFSVLKTGFGMLSAPILAFVAALAGIVAVILVIVDNWNTFKEMFGGVVDYAKSVWHDMIFVMSAAWEGFVDVLGKGLEALGLDELAGKMRAALSPDALGSSIKGIGQSIASAVSDGLSTAFKSAERGAKKVGDALGINDMLAKLNSFVSSSKGKARQGQKNEYDYTSTLADEMARDEKFRQQDVRAEQEQSVDYSAGLAGDMAMTESRIDTSNSGVDVAGTVIAAVTNKLGELGGVINSIVQGAQSGGVWGAIIAAIMEIISRMKGFTDVLDGAMQLIYTIADSLEPILTPIFDFLKDIFTDIGNIFKDLAPLWRTLGTLIKWLLTPIEWLIKGIEWLVAAVTGVHEAEFRSKVLTDAMGEKDAATKANKVDFYDARYGKGAFDRDAQNTNDMLTVTTSLIDSAIAHKKAQDDANESLKVFNEALSDATQNVPKGVKLALARFNSQDGTMPGSTAQEAPYSIGPVYVNAASGKQLWDELVGVAAGEANLKMGSSGAVLRALKGF